MPQPDDTLYVTVEYHDGQTEGDDGHPYYVATGVQIGAVTDGRTLDEEDTVETYNIVPNPRVSIVMELPAYAQIA